MSKEKIVLTKKDIDELFKKCEFYWKDDDGKIWGSPELIEKIKRKVKK